MSSALYSDSDRPERDLAQALMYMGREVSAMSQRNVEKVIGRLVTDEGFRRRFATDPPAVIQRLVEGGVELNPCERRALADLDFRRIALFAEGLDPCILKVELGRHPS